MTLRSVAISASRWTTLAVILSAALSVGQVFVLARILNPADFGLMAIAGAFLAITVPLADFGLSNALVHFSMPKKEVLSALFWMNFGLGLILMSVVIAVSLPVSSFYGLPALMPIMALVSVVIPLRAAGQQFRAIAQKELRFSVLATIEVLSALAGFCLSVGAGFAGAGAYALVIGIMGAALVSTALSWCLLSSGLRPGLVLDWKGSIKFLSYGGFQLGDNLLNTLRMQSDVLIGGTIAGTATVGIYTVPRDLSLKLANSIVNPVVTRVGLPVMAKVKDDSAALKSIYLQTMRMTSSINFPVYAILVIWAENFVSVLLGPQWMDAVLFLQIFALWGMIRSTGNPSGSLIYAVGLVRRAFLWNLALLLVVPPALWISAVTGGMQALAVSMLLLQVLMFYPAFRVLIKPSCGATFLEYLSQLFPPFLATGVAAVVVLLILHMDSSGSLAFSLVNLVSFVLIYAFLSFFINRSFIQVIVELCSPLIGRN